MVTTYKSAGVDIDAGDRFVDAIVPIAKSTMRPEVIDSIGGFAGCFALDTAKYKQPVLVAATDGVGTKLKIAQLAKRHDTVGIDLVAMCVNDLIVCGAEPLFFLDYFATAHLDIEEGRQVLEGIGEGCRQAGCALLGGETAEMPGFYRPGEYDLAGFAVGVVERDQTLGAHRVQVGDVLLGLASNGLHSNGFSLVRKVLLSDNPEPGELEQPCCVGGPSLAEVLLAPTRIYVRLVQDLGKALEIHALAHITGGGLPGNLPRVFPDHLSARLQMGSWPVPAIFDRIQTQGSVPKDDMLATFNMGIGMVVVLPPAAVDIARNLASKHGVESFEIGRIEARSAGGPGVVIDG